MIEWLATPAPFFHDVRTCASVVNGPVEYPFPKDLVENAPEPFTKVVSPSAGFQKTKTVQDFPNGNGGDTKTLPGRPVEKLGDSWLRGRAHHLGDNVGIEEISRRGIHIESSRSSSTGR